MPDNDLHSTAFPKLDQTQLAGLGQCSFTKRKHYQDGEALFRGERDPRFYVLIAGKVEVVDESGDAPKTVVVHGPGEFAGDLSQLTGRPAMVSGYARGGVRCTRCRRTPSSSSSTTTRPGQPHPPGLHRPPATPAGIGRLHGASGGRVALLAGHVSVRDFLSRNGVLHTWLDLDADPQVRELLHQFGLAEADTPVVACGRKVILKNPSNRQLAEGLGLRRKLEPKVYDLVVVGAGPAGLAAAVYGASEGLSTVVLETTAPGGQAGRSMRIENYLGFPTGYHWERADGAGRRPGDQVRARPASRRQAVGLSFDGPTAVVRLEGEETVRGKCLLIATGAEYRVLGVEGCERYEGRGVYYAATPIKAQVCRGAEVVVVGGGNSAGQAAVFLPGTPERSTSRFAATTSTRTCPVTSPAGWSPRRTFGCCATPWSAGSKATGRWNRSNW